MMFAIAEMCSAIMFFRVVAASLTRNNFVPCESEVINAILLCVKQISTNIKNIKLKKIMIF